MGPGEPFSNPTDLVDYVLSVLTSDIGSGILGLIGIVICLCNRLSSIDYDALTIDPTAAAAMGQQSRSDLLGVFASGAVLLNGLSKLDVTSVLAEKVVLEGVELPRPIIIHSDENLASDMDWALNSIIAATPANTAVVLKFVKEKWIPLAIAGVVPFEKELQTELPVGSATPILNRFLTQKAAKESYLPTLQALPGKVEFTFTKEYTRSIAVTYSVIRRWKKRCVSSWIRYCKKLFTSGCCLVSSDCQSYGQIFIIIDIKRYFSHYFN